MFLVFLLFLHVSHTYHLHSSPVVINILTHQNQGVSDKIKVGVKKTVTHSVSIGANRKGNNDMSYASSFKDSQRTNWNRKWTLSPQQEKVLFEHSVPKGWYNVSLGCDVPNHGAKVKYHVEEQPESAWKNHATTNYAWAVLDPVYVKDGAVSLKAKNAHTASLTVFVYGVKIEGFTCEAGSYIDVNNPGCKSCPEGQTSQEGAESCTSA